MAQYFFKSTYFFICFGLIFISQRIFAQRDSIPPMDKSVMDLSYCPPFYPIHKAQDRIIEPLVARAIYSRPAKNNRQLFGKLVEYGKIWRLGANEATEIEFFRDVIIQKTKIKKGRYTLYAIPGLETCTLIINKEIDTWGAFLYEEKKDVLRVTLPMETLDTPMENFTLYFTLSGTNAKMVCMWDTYSFTLPFSVPKLK
jgi:hypothetical protein